MPKIDGVLLHQLPAAKQQGTAIDGAADPQSGPCGHFARRGDGQVTSLYCRHDRPGEGMLTALLERDGQPEQRVFRQTRDRVGGHEGRPADGEGAGLVEGHDGHGVGDLQRLGVLDENAIPGGDPGPGHDGGRRRQAQGAGTGDDQHGDRVEDRRLPVTGRKPPSEQGEQGDTDHGRDEDRGDPVDQPLDRGLGDLGVLHQPDDPRQGRFRADGPGPHDEQPIPIDGTAGDPVADPLGHWQALTRDERFVEMTPTFDHLAIDRDPFTRSDHHQVPHPHLRDGHIPVTIRCADAGDRGS